MPHNTPEYQFRRARFIITHRIRQDAPLPYFPTTPASQLCTFGDLIYTGIAHVDELPRRMAPEYSFIALRHTGASSLSMASRIPEIFAGTLAASVSV